MFVLANNPLYTWRTRKQLASIGNETTINSELTRIIIVDRVLQSRQFAVLEYRASGGAKRVRHHEQLPVLVR